MGGNIAVKGSRVRGNRKWLASLWAQSRSAQLLTGADAACGGAAEIEVVSHAICNGLRFDKRI